MSIPIAVVGKDSAGGSHVAPAAQGFWFVEDALVMTVGGPVSPHGKPPHAGPVMASGSSWMTLTTKGGAVDIPCRQGDIATCGHRSSGRPWWSIS